jgi:hypothetical protein
MQKLSMSSAMHRSAWRDRLVRQQNRLEHTRQRFSHTTPDRSDRGAVASFVFINSADRKEVNSHE